MKIKLDDSLIIDMTTAYIIETGDGVVRIYYENADGIVLVADTASDELKTQASYIIREECCNRLKEYLHNKCLDIMNYC